MNYHKTCPHCGTVTTAYLVNLNEPLIAAFIIFAEARIRLGRPVKKSELALDHSQYGNFQKLRHFSLIEKREGNAWEMRQTGWCFLRGQTLVYTPAAQFGNATLDAHHEAWKTHPTARRGISIAQVLPKGWEQRAEYAAQKQGVA